VCHLSAPFFALLLVGFLAGFCPVAAGQSADDVPPPAQPAAGTPLTAIEYAPATGTQRLRWIVDGTVGPRSLFIVGPLGASLQTAYNWPSEWDRSWNGVAKRYGQREADVAISNTIEAGLGALWGEEPRYVPSGRRGIGPRARYAIKTAFLAQRRDGRLAPAWGRYAGNVVNNLIENTWLPPSATTAGQTVTRSVLGLLGRLGGNAWEEFWPDARRLLTKK
jgi:hypothetical protein